MQITVQPNPSNITTVTATPDVGQYAKVTIDGNQAGTYSIEVVPGGLWDDDAVGTALCTWFSITPDTTPPS
jgi:hypothetical protein